MATSIVRRIGALGDQLGDSITVGDGGIFSTLHDALTYLCGLTGADVWTETVGAGTVSVTQHSDAVTGSGTSFLSAIEPGDYVSIAGDGAPLATGTLCHTLWGVKSNTSLRLGTGFLGASGSGKSYSIWRPVKYSVLLLPGAHDLTSTFVLPQGMHLTIAGCGIGVTTLRISTATPGIHFQRSNHIDFGNMSVFVDDTLELVFGISSGLGVTDCGLGKFNIHDIDCDYYGEESTTIGPQVMVLRGSSIRISNITGRCASAFAVTMADHIEYDNVYFEAGNAGADCLQTTGYNASSCTKPWIYNNVGVIRPLAGITGAGAMCELNGVVYVDTAFGARKKVYVNNSYFIDSDQQGSTNPSCMQVATTMANADIYLNNVIIDGVRGLNLAGTGANCTVYGKNVRNLSDQPPGFIGTVTPYYAITNGAQSVAYAATITPKPGLGSTINVGALTGNLIVEAPLYPVRGQRITFIFTQDATGGRTITWNAVFKKAADGAGAASQKGATTFEYDGTNWMQVSGALAWA